ncbi:transcriptional regulator TyrR, partial [Pseudoalteromonas sp. S1649]
INHLLKGFNFTSWLEGKDVLGKTSRVEDAGEDFIADILAISVPQGDEGDVLAGAVINIKSQSRLRQQVSAFSRYGQERIETIHKFSTAMRSVVLEASKMGTLASPLFL